MQMARSLRTLSALALALAIGAAPAAPASPNAFGVALFQKLAASQKNTNVFISPASIGIALAMVEDGTAGTTRSEIARVIGPQPAIVPNADAKIGIANAVWTRHDIPPLPSYVALLKTKYGAAAKALNFGDPSAAAAINAWTSQHTLGLIPKLVDTTSPMDFAYVTNALSFEAKWSLPFSSDQTQDGTFTSASGNAHSVRMMAQSASFYLSDGASYRTLRMPYGKGGYAAYILLPNQANGIDALVASLPGAIASLGSAHQTFVAVRVPRFSASYRSSLNDALAALGIRRAFERGADFAPLHPAPPSLRLSTVDHAAFVRVDEAGTVAAAATSAGIRMTAIRMPTEKPFVVDHPFVFLIRDEATSRILFLGRIDDV